MLQASEGLQLLNDISTIGRSIEPRIVHVYRSNVRVWKLDLVAELLMKSVIRVEPDD